MIWDDMTAIDIYHSNTYIYEIMLLALVAMYAVILIVGRASNKQVVEKWYEKLLFRNVCVCVLISPSQVFAI